MKKNSNIGVKKNALAKPAKKAVATKAEAQAIDKEVVHLVGDMKSSWLRLGKLVQKVIDTRAWAQLGFANMHEWITARLGESASSAFSALRSIRALQGVPEEKLKQIGERNANALTYLPEKQRKSAEWIDKATTLPTKEFKDEIKVAVEKATGHPVEEFRTFSLRVPKDVYGEMIDAETKVAKLLVLDIENKPGLRAQVWSAIVSLINLSEDGQLVIEMTGDVDGVPAKAANG